MHTIHTRILASTEMGKKMFFNATNKLYAHEGAYVCQIVFL